MNSNLDPLIKLEDDREEKEDDNSSAVIIGLDPIIQVGGLMFLN